MPDHIVINDIRPRIQYTADGVQTVFTYPFPIFAAADLKVYLGEALQAAGYTVAGAGQSAGGSVTFAAAPANGTKVTLLRALAVARTSDFQEGGAFRAKTINDELDRQTAFVQEVGERIERALVAGPTESVAPLVLPAPSARANRFLGFDALGAPIAASGTVGTVPVASAMVPLVQANDLAAARAALGLGTAATKNHGTGDADVPLGTQSRLARLAESVKSADYAVAASDAGAMLVADKPTAIAFTLPAAASLGAGFAVMARNIGAGDLTLDPAGAETINGAATLVLKQNEAALVWCTGAAWRANVWGVAVSGKLVQRNYAEYTTYTSTSSQIPQDDSVPQNTEGLETVTCSITPTNGSNRLRVTCTGFVAGSTNEMGVAALFRDDIANAKRAVRFLASNGSSSANAGGNFVLMFEEIAGAGSPTTYKLRIGCSSGSTTHYINGVSGGRLYGGIAAHVMTIEELIP